METKVCSVCGKQLPLSAYRYHTSRNGARHLFHMCEDCRCDTIRNSVVKRKETIERNKAINEEKRRSELTSIKNCRLAEFTPRELMEELARRGYAGKLTFTRVEEIDITNF